MTDPKYKILQVISGLDIGGELGGAERFGLELARSLDRDQFDLAVYAYWKYGTEAEAHWLDQLQAEGIPIFFASQWRGKFHWGEYVQGVGKLTRLCNREGYDLLSSHFQMGTVACIWAKALSTAKKTVRTAHITLEWGERPIAWLLRKTMTNWVFPIFLEQEVGVSRAIVSQLAGHPGARLFNRTPLLIHNAIPSKLIEGYVQKPIPNTLSIEKEDVLIGSVGGLVRRKGYEYLIQAAPDILRAIPAAKFILIGEGERRPALEQLSVDLNVAERFQFLGQIDNVYPILKAMDLFVLPSLWEGFPTVVLESMTCGTPVIATDIPGTNELITDRITGRLVKPKDPKGLSDAILEVLTEGGGREEYIANAKEHVLKFSFSIAARKYADMYRNVLGKSG